jgi:hypothetical protein
MVVAAGLRMQLKDEGGPLSFACKLESLARLAR